MRPTLQSVIGHYEANPVISKRTFMIYEADPVISKRTQSSIDGTCNILHYVMEFPGHSESLFSIHLYNNGWGIQYHYHTHLYVTILLAHDPLSSLAYPMITHWPPVASNLPIKTLVARQQPTNTCIPV